jgi:hypothetical protein
MREFAESLRSEARRRFPNALDFVKRDFWFTVNWYKKYPGVPSPLTKPLPVQYARMPERPALTPANDPLAAVIRKVGQELKPGKESARKTPADQRVEEPTSKAGDQTRTKQDEVTEVQITVVAAESSHTHQDNQDASPEGKRADDASTERLETESVEAHGDVNPEDKAHAEDRVASEATLGKAEQEPSDLPDTTARLDQSRKERRQLRERLVFERDHLLEQAKAKFPGHPLKQSKWACKSWALRYPTCPPSVSPGWFWYLSGKLYAHRFKATADSAPRAPEPSKEVYVKQHQDLLTEWGAIIQLAKWEHPEHGQNQRVCALELWDTWVSSEKNRKWISADPTLEAVARQLRRKLRTYPFEAQSIRVSEASPESEDLQSSIGDVPPEAAVPVLDPVIQDTVSEPSPAGEGSQSKIQDVAASARVLAARLAPVDRPVQEVILTVLPGGMTETPVGMPLTYRIAQGVQDFHASEPAAVVHALFGSTVYSEGSIVLRHPGATVIGPYTEVQG